MSIKKLQLKGKQLAAIGLVCLTMASCGKMFSLVPTAAGTGQATNNSNDNSTNQLFEDTPYQCVSDSAIPSGKLCYQEIDGRALVQRDMDFTRLLSGEVQVHGEDGEHLRANFVAGVYSTFVWPSYVIPYTIDPSVPASELPQLQEALATYNGLTTTQWVPRTTQTGYVTFNYNPNNNGICEAEVGYLGIQQFVTLDPGCFVPQILHIMGHILGEWHEQVRNDRDSYISINCLNTADHTLVNGVCTLSPLWTLIGSQGQAYGAYDYDSIMHYNSFADSNGQPTMLRKDNGQPIQENLSLSAGDIAALAHFYPSSLGTPNPPSGFAVNANSATQQAVLTWNDTNAGTSAYFIERSSSGGAFTGLALVGGNSYTDSNLNGGVTYSYQVAAIRSGILSAYAGPINVVMLAPPAGFNATVTGPNQVVLTWGDSNGGQAVYHIERAASGGGFGEIAQVAAINFVDNSLSASTTYSYRARASGAAGFSAYSNVITVTTQGGSPPPPPPPPPVTPPAAPGVGVAGLAFNAITLGWSESNPNISYYLVMEKHGRWRTLAQVPGNQSSFTIGGLKQKTVYHLRVEAVNPAGAATSGILNVRTPKKPRR